MVAAPSNKGEGMREAIGRWLEPLIAAVEERDDVSVQALMNQATTVTKPERSHGKWLPRVGDEEERSLDWVRFGQLLREALGWHD